MKPLLLALLTTVALASSATAGNFAFSLPNLSFPPATDGIVTKDCIDLTTTTDTCVPQR